MKTNILFLIFLVSSIRLFAQADRYGNPVFNSVEIETDSVSNCLLSSNYYTLKNNIDNKNTSAYISDVPTLDEIENAMVNLPSYFFVIVVNHNMQNIISIINKPSKKFLVVNPSTGKQKKSKFIVEGDVFEKRAKEIIENNYDKDARIENGKLYFNKKTYTIISDSNLKASVTALISDKNLYKDNGSKIRYYTKEELKDMIVKESSNGGKLDFFTKIKVHEYDGIQIKQGLYATKLEVSLYMWGRANYEACVNTADDALDIWKTFKVRNANEKEKYMIMNGFNKKFD